MNKSGIELIVAERQRQISKEKWSASHDDGHEHKELARAATAYALHYVSRGWTFKDEPKTYQNEKPPDEWPWDDIDWNPQDPIRDLVKAGALIAAELDRLERLKHTNIFV